MSTQVSPSPSDLDSAFRVVFDRAPLPMWVAERISLRILAVNDAAVSRYGYSREEFLAMTAFDVQAPTNRERFARMMDDEGDADNVAHTSVHRRKDGAELEIDVVAHAISFEGRAARLVIGRDVTTERRAAAALRASEQQLRAQFMAIPVPTYAWRAVDGGFVLTGFNHAAMRLTEGRIQEWIGQRADAMFTSSDPDYVTAMRECLLHDQPVVLDVRHRLVSTGEVRDMAVTFAPVQPDHVLVHTVDETDRRAAERALRASEERFRALIENSMELVSILDAEGRFQFVSQSYQPMLGYSVSDLVGTLPHELVHPEDLPACQAALADIASRSDQLVRVRCRVRHRDGTFRTLDMTAQNLLAHPAIHGIVCNGRDVTDREAAEVERRELEEQLRQSQKLEAVGKLAGGVAHDFNNLLTVVRANAEFVRSALRNGAPPNGELDQILCAVDRAASLTRQLLAFSRKQVLSPKPLDLNAVVRDMQRMFERLIGEDIVLDTDLAENLGCVFADHGQIEQVLMNLLVNARDAMPEGGTVTITTADVDLHKPVNTRAGMLAPGSYVMISVRDTGHGMDRGTLDHIFEPFFTTKGVGNGTGLGLSTVHGIVHQSRGCVWVYSELGKGSVFEVYLPRHDATTESLDAMTPRTVEPGSERLLLVEDEEGVRAVLARMLRQLGYSVMEACGGRQALELFLRHMNELDLVVTDMVMPGINGRELADTLRRIRPGVRVLFMSGYTEDEIVRRGIGGEPHFLQKPFTFENLGSAVRAALRRR